MVLPASAFAIQKPRPQDRVLPNFDTRFRGPRAATIPPEVEKALAGLRRQTSLTLEARFHPLSRAVRVLSAREGALTPPSAEAAEEVARGFLRAHRDLFALSEADVSSLVRTREYQSQGERIRHVQFQQVIDGIPVFGAVVGVHLDEAGRVVFVSNNALPAQGATGAASSAPASRLAAEDAIRAAVANVRPELALEPQLVSPPSGRERRATFARGPLKRDIPARLVYFPGRPRPRLAWRVLVEPAGFPQAYDIVVDAETGQVVYRRNRVYYADGVANVVQSEATALRDARLLDEHPGGSAAAGGADPETGCPPLTGYSSRSLTAPFRDPGTVLFSAGRLAGNNARAYRGSVGAFGALGTADGGGSWHFEFPFDTAESAEAHLFFAANFLHDFFYDLGFDEAAGNFQVDNLGRGGLGGDPLNALARADGRNNATFEPQPEGVSPTMSMFLFDGVGCWSEDVDGDGEPDLDGDYDSDIFIHEYHHGVSHRLNTDFTGDEADAMGEGGSDFFAYSINGNTKLAEYVAPPDGIRQVNAKTYADWACYDFFFFFICEPHDNGEIWANTLWDMREQFRADLVKGSEGAAVNEVHQLYVDGLKLSPGSPTMLDMRDAMLQADQDRNPSGDIGGSENYCRMWLAFAGRGLGIHARDTQDTGDATVVADTSLPAICPAPPPKPTVTVTASDPTAAEAGLDTASFTFTRNGSTDAALVVGYTVAGSATPGSDYVRLPGTVTIPAGAADATVILTPLDDPLVEGDETVEVDLAVSSAYVIGAPASAIARIVSEDVAPDLLVFVTAPYLIAPGVPVALADTTSNQGTGVSTASVTRFYLSRDGAIDAADIVLGSRTVPPVAVGASSSGSTSVTIPAGTVAGEYVLIAEADSDRTNDEMVETNNNGYAAVRIGADLIITAISSFTSGAGEAVTLSDTTYNVGAGAAPASVTRYYLSVNPVVDAADILLGSRAVPALASRTGSSGAITATIPVGTPAGVYNLIGQADGDGTVPETQETNNTSYSIVYVGPDLAIAAVTAPATGGAGSAVTVSDTTKNLGGGGASASVTRFYLSANNVLDAADTLLGSRPVPALAAGATSVGSTTLTIPAAQAPGTYFLLAQADGNDTVPEHCEVNNLNWAVIQIGPDLTITTLTAPPSAGPGMAVTVGDTTRNQGGGNAAASITKFYLSTNATLEAGDTLLGSRPVPALAAGATSAGSATVTIPAGTGPGTYYVIAQADGDGAVAETSESNNVATAAFQLGPDLVVSPLAAPPSSGAGAAIVVNDTTVNQGAGPAAASVTRFYLSANAVLDFSDTLLGSRAVSALGATASSSGSTTVTIPAGTAPGQYYVIAQADGEQSIPEVQESNNTAAVAIQIGPDLIVNAFTAPATSGTGSAFTVSETTRNQAGGVSAACVTKFFLSADTTLDAADTLVGSRSVPALGPGASSAVSTALTVPAGTAAGLYYLFAQADGDGTVAETSETNNTSLVSIQVGPDLMVASLLGPAAAGAGTAISVSDTTRNQGGGSAVPSATRIYLSTNALLDAGDTLLGGRTVPALAAGTSSAGSTTVTIPPATAAGSYYLIAQADGDGAVAETAEGNNTATAAIQIGPDLIVLSLTGPPSGGAGGSITVNDTTRNQASALAPASATRFYLSVNGVIDASDTLLGSRAVPALAGATSSSASTALTIPAGTPAGPYYLIAQADGDQVVSETQEANNTALVFIWVGPDLTVAALSAPPTADAGAAISVSDTTRNQGGGSAAASVTRIYLSTNNLLDAGDTLLGGRTLPALAAGASNAGSTTVTIPPATPVGSYYLIAQADGDGAVAETAESNNTAAAAIQIGPDLIVLSLTGPPSGGAGGSITVNDTTRNQASAVAPASATRFYLSVNGVLDASDVLLGSRAVPALAGATSSSGSTTLTIPAGTPSGPFYLIAQADGDQVVSETQETNNTALVFIWVGPDLTVAALSAPPTTDAGAAISVSDTTRNQGGGSAAASVTRIYLSTNTVVDAGDTLLGSRDVGPLAAGTSSAGSTTVTIPPATAAGSYYLIAQADGDGAVAETAEGNNTAAAAIQIGPDLIVLSLTGPPWGGASGSITVNDTTRNQASASAPASATRFYLSVNGVIDASDTLLGSRAVPALAGATSSSASTALTIPAGTPAGPYYLIAQADGDQVVSETQEANNTALVFMWVGPDLTVAAVTAPPTADAGAAISVSDTTRNQGGGSATASVTRIYLSTNSVVDAGDTLLGSRDVAPLAAGASSAGSTTVTIPASVATGSYYLLVQADAGGAVAEALETNNLAQAYVQIGPDLTMTIAAPSSAAAGSAITVSDTVRNQGGGAAPATTSRFYLSANGSVDGGDALLGVRATPAIAAGGQDSGSSPFTIPAGTAPGTYYILSLADADNAVPEILETNNLGWRVLQVTP